MHALVYCYGEKKEEDITEYFLNKVLVIKFDLHM